MTELQNNKRILALFDVDGTLTPPREEVTEDMKSFLLELNKRITVGIVGGSDLIKQQEQMGRNIVNEVTYSFSENGLVAYKDGELIGKQVLWMQSNMFACIIMYDLDGRILLD